MVLRYRRNYLFYIKLDCVCQKVGVKPSLNAIYRENLKLSGRLNRMFEA